MKVVRSASLARPAAGCLVSPPTNSTNEQCASQALCSQRNPPQPSSLHTLAWAASLLLSVNADCGAGASKFSADLKATSIKTYHAEPRGQRLPSCPALPSKAPSPLPRGLVPPLSLHVKSIFLIVAEAAVANKLICPSISYLTRRDSFAHSHRGDRAPCVFRSRARRKTRRPS